MSEQVKRYDGQMMLGGTAIAAGFKTGMVTGRDYDALHAEAEALRAENAALQAKVVAQDRLIRQSGDWIESVRDEVLCHLANGTEHAVAIHEEAHALYQTSASLIADIDAFLTATQALEVQAEQGERQEVACWVPRACLDKLRNGHNNSPAVLTDGPAEFNDTPLYTTPQPGPDVRGLVEALEGMLEYFPEGNSDGECFSIEKSEAALAAHRQAQRKGDSHDT